MTHQANKTVHIVSFDIPYPADYGGVIDVFFKIKALHSLGINIILHCYEYGRSRQSELEKYCKKVYYYERHVSKTNLFKAKPYIVASRNSKDLLNNLLQDNNPILFEGLHTCFYLNEKLLESRHKIVRTHNIEHEYYNNLANVEKNIFKKYYFLNEAYKLKLFEDVLNFANEIAVISQNDINYFGSKYHNTNLVSAFHPNDEVSINSGKGKFVLYHGSLSIGENNKAALFLIEDVFSKIDIPFVIAGNKASKELKNAVDRYPHISLKTNISTEEIYRLIKEAQINILPTFQATGIKLKLLAALFNGRHCLVNNYMVIDTGLEALCYVANSPDEFITELKRLFYIDFSADDIIYRKEFLKNNGFANKENAQKLQQILFP